MHLKNQAVSGARNLKVYVSKQSSISAETTHQFSQETGFYGRKLLFSTHLKLIDLADLDRF